MMALYDAQPLSFSDIITSHDQPEEHQHEMDIPQEEELQTFFVKALYDYQSTDASSLSFHRGDVIEVLTQLESGWWDGLLGEERGWFPSNYVELVPDEEVEAEVTANQQQPPVSEANQPPPEQHSMEPNAVSSTRDDFWVPRVTNNGQIFFLNTRTGERSAEDPSAHHDSIVDHDFPAPPVAAVVAPTVTATPTVSAASEAPSPWVKRTVGDGLAFFWANEETGQIRWSAPSPLVGRRGGARLPDTDPDSGPDDQWSRRLLEGENHGLVVPSEGAMRMMNRLSVYSDDSEIRPPDHPSPPMRASNGQSTSSGSPPRTDGSTTYDGPSGESLARQLQAMLLPPSGDRIESLSNDVREAIASVVEAVGASTSSPNTPAMASRVAAVVTAVRNLLYVSGTLTTPSSNLHLSSRLVEEESSRQPLTELKPHQRKVTATLSKLVLSARAAASNPDWPYDDATTRVDSDAAELENAVVKFVMEVKRLEVMAGVILTEKRLEGILVSGDGLAGVGTQIYGAGSAAEWRGLGFVPPEPEEGRVAPQWPLGEDVLAELKSFKSIIEDGLDTICENEMISVELLIPRLRNILSHLTAFLGLAEDIDVARTIDVDGIMYPSPNPLEPAVVEEYTATVHSARKFIRKLEIDKQAVYDDGSSLWAFAQAAFADSELDTLSLLSDFQLHDGQSRSQLINNAAGLLKSAINDTTGGYVALLGLAKNQEDAHKRGVRGSIGARVGRLKDKDAGDIMPLSAVDSNISMSDLMIDQGGDPEDVVDVGFALGRGKGKAPQYQNVVQLGAPTKNGAPSGSHHQRGPSTSTAAPTYRENEQDGDGTSTIRQSTDLPPPSYHQQDESDEEDEDDLNYGRRKPPVKSPARGAKIIKVFGEDAPAHYLATQNASQQPWYLRTDTDEKEILINPDGGVRGGTLRALVERMTLHNYRDAVYNDTFLITFKSFTNVDELFDLLVERFNVPEPEGLSPDERQQWVSQKQLPIRVRVINTLKIMLMDGHLNEKEDVHVLDRIQQFALSVAEAVPAAKQLVVLVDRAMTGEIGRVTKTTNVVQPPPPIPPKSSKNIKLLDVDTLEMARQLTIMESKLFLKIRPMECLQRAKEGSGEDDSIRTIINTSNKIASWVAQQVLSKDDPKRRGAVIKQFVTVAEKCRELKNFSTMAALIAGLNSPPIRRLKRTWEQVGGRFSQQLDDVEKTLDSGRSFNGYRALLATTDPPCIPFLGVYLTVLTFIQDGNKDLLVKEGNLINFSKRQKAAEVIREIKKYQSKTYNLHELSNVQEFIETSLAGLENAPDFWDLSLDREPKEREDEKMARLLQESGFL